MNIHKLIFGASILTLLCIQPSMSASNEIMTDWLGATKGNKGQTFGAEVIKVRQDGETIIVDVDIPIADLENYETVLIVGKKTNNLIQLVQEPKLLRDDDNAYGIRFQVKRLPGFEFRLRLSDSNEE